MTGHWRERPTSCSRDGEPFCSPTGVSGMATTVICSRCRRPGPTSGQRRSGATGPMMTWQSPGFWMKAGELGLSGNARLGDGPACRKTRFSTDASNGCAREAASGVSRFGDQSGRSDLGACDSIQPLRTSALQAEQATRGSSFDGSHARNEAQTLEAKVSESGDARTSVLEMIAPLRVGNRINPTEENRRDRKALARRCGQNA